MLRTYMQQNSEWFANSDPFSRVGDMESEIAELRTLTKVTQLRKQIECREEGAWMVVKDVPDNRAPSGVRKVTSYGMTKRSVTRSISSNIDIDKIFGEVKSNEPVVQLPCEESEEDVEPSTVEITEIFDDPLKTDIPEFQKEKVSEKSGNKKTSVVTLGKGNLVLIDPEDDNSNFHVTGISKGKVADVVNTLEKSSDKKVKKVGFCKTEVHFAPDSGKINIVETDEKPPPTQVYRKKKRTKGVRNGGSNRLPKHYFGEIDDFGDDSNLSNESDKEDNKSHFPTPLDTGSVSHLREKLPAFEKTIKSEGKDTKYRHSSPEKINFNVEKIESEGKEFLKKVKQPSFRDKFLKDTSYVQEKMFSDKQPKMENLVKNLDKHPRLRNNLSMYGICDDAKEKDLLKSNSKLINCDYAPIYNSKADFNSSLHESTVTIKNSDESVKEGLNAHDLKYTELLRFPSPLVENGVKKQITNRDNNVLLAVQMDEISESNYNKLNKNGISDKVLDISHSSRASLDQDMRPGISFLGNISPKLQNLIQNSVEHEFQLRQKQILQKKTLEERKSPHHVNEKTKSSVTVNLNSSNTDSFIINKSEPKSRSTKAVTQVLLKPESDTKHEFQLKRDEITKNLFNEPIYGNEEVPYLLNEEPVPAPRSKKEIPIKKDVSRAPPKPKPRTIASLGERNRVPKTPNTRVMSRNESSLSSKRVRSRESLTKSKETEKGYSRLTVSKEDGKCKKLQNQALKGDTTTSNKISRVVKVSSETKGKKTSREPLRSFEKVSNGWVGHLVPVKQDGITVTTKVYSSKAPAQGVHSSGLRRSSQTSSVIKTTMSHSLTTDRRRDPKQFSLSKEHLNSAKLVKEISPRKVSSARKISSGKIDKGESYHRPRARRESERSDDSVVRADEEVRAYMFDGHKNKHHK